MCLACPPLCSIHAILETLPVLSKQSSLSYLTPRFLYSRLRDSPGGRAGIRGDNGSRAVGGTMSKRWQKQRVVNSLHCLKSDGIVRERISIRRRIEEREDVVELPRAMYSRMLKEGVNVVCRRVEESKKNRDIELP